MFEAHFLVIVCFVFGALFGSFANVVIYRLPKNLSVVRPRSHCYSCKKQVRWFDNFPILAWFWLRGKCRFCNASFSFRYPFIEALMAVLFAVVAWRTGLSWTLLEYLVFTFGLVVISFIDLDHFIIPDVFSLSGIVLGLIGAALNPEREFLDAFTGVLLGGGFLYAIAYAYAVIRKEDGLGGGDIKLLGWIGAVLGWQAIPFVIFTASVVGSIIGVVLMIRRKTGLKTALPFGPYLACASMFLVAGGDRLAHDYLRLFFPWLE